MTTYYARRESTGNGSQKDFTFISAYLSTTHVKVTIDGATYTNFTVSGSTVTMAAAPSNGAAVVIYRQTPLDVIQSFVKLGTPSSGGFNELFLRLQYIAQEFSDTTTAFASIGTSVAAAVAAAAAASASATSAASAASTATTAAENATAIATGTITTKGDILTRDSTAVTRLAVGTDGYVLTADAAQTKGIKWAAIPTQNTAASIAETLTGTDSAKFVTPDGLASLWEKAADISSASTINIPSGGGELFHITGTTTITAISQGAALKTGRQVTFVFDGALTLTHNATSLILPNNGSNITTAAGDSATFRCEDSASNYWRCIRYTKANGQALQAASGGSGLQNFQVFTASGTYTRSANVTKAFVVVIGGGGSGGAGTTAQGGGGGGCSIKWITSGLGSTESVTIGAGGAGSGGVGNSGGTSSFGSHCSATGGAGGSTTANTASVGGAGSSGTINYTGPSAPGVASSTKGPGAIGPYLTSATYGAGSDGVASVSSAGKDGLVMVWEYA